MDILILKTGLMGLLIRFIIKHPDIMESKLFLKAMAVFPSKISKSYDDKIAEIGEDYQAALEKGLPRIRKNPRRILDLCTGTGFAAFAASDHFPDATIEAIDQSKEMIRIAMQKASAKNKDAIQFKIGNSTALQYNDNTFDLMITSNAPVYLSEAARVLKPGGLILIAYSFSGPSFVKAAKHISRYLAKDGLTLLEIKNVRKGAYILGRK
ncbi:MAG: class I SAM-dependent methyltransferase [Deltaproteobacteria bacterium]|nr:class I SAM-dependent methyltransferase [Deltaproteobacteria bacterium]